MVRMGLLIGAVFPMRVVGFGVPKTTALAPTFIFATLVSGFALSWLNFALARGIVRPRLKQLATGLLQVRSAMQQATFSGDWSSCAPAICRLNERDEDELGAVAHSYNALLYALHEAHHVEAQIRDFTGTLSSSLSDLKNRSENLAAGRGHILPLLPGDSGLNCPKKR